MYHASLYRTGVGGSVLFRIGFFQDRIRDEEARKQSEFSLRARSGEGRREEVQITGSCMFIMDLIVY